jgi:hypothetical protein
LTVRETAVGKLVHSCVGETVTKDLRAAIRR